MEGQLGPQHGSPGRAEKLKERMLDEFVALHGPALRASGVPERLWGRLLHKLEHEVRGCAGSGRALRTSGARSTAAAKGNHFQALERGVPGSQRGTGRELRPSRYPAGSGSAEGPDLQTDMRLARGIPAPRLACKEEDLQLHLQMRKVRFWRRQQLLLDSGPTSTNQFSQLCAARLGP